MTKEIYLYNIGLNTSKKIEIDSEIADFIYLIATKYIGNRDEIEVTDDPLQLKLPILEWLNRGKIHPNQITPFCNKLRGELKTRSVEAQRNLIIFLRTPKDGEPFLYIIHTSEKIEVLDGDFKEIIEMGLGPGKILRLLQFSRLSPSSILLSYREKYKSKLLINLFKITSDRYESAGKIILRGTFGSSLNFKIELTPSELLNHLNSNNIKFEKDGHINIFDRYDLILEEIKYRKRYYPPSLKKIEDFLKEIKDEFDEFENLIEKFLMEYQSKKMQLGIDNNYVSLEKFLNPDEFPDPDSIKIYEDRYFIKFFINNNLKFKLEKPEDPWGEFFVLDDYIDLSEEFAKQIAHEILFGPLRKVRLIKIPPSRDPIVTGQYYWHNYFEISKNIRKILEMIQNEYKKSDSDRKKRLLLITLLSILEKGEDSVYLSKFFSKICKYIIYSRDSVVMRDISEDNFFEFKRSDILNPSLSLDDKIKKICKAISPNLNNTGLSILLVGYDEDKNQMTPIKLNYYRAEVCQMVSKGIKQELSNQDLIIKILLINIEKSNEGLIIFIVADKNFKDQIEFENLFN